MALTGHAAAFELRLWPLLELKISPTHQTVHLLGPLVEWNSSEAGKELLIRPLLHWTENPESNHQEGTVLYPALRWETGRRTFASLFGLANVEINPDTGRRFTLFPLIFWREHEEGRSSLAIFPLYADIPNFLGYQRVQTVLFPLWLRLTEPQERCTWIGFPFLSRVAGPDSHGLRLWPLHGSTVLGHREQVSYWMWPFYIRHIEHPGRKDRTIHQISWPLFSSIDSPKLQSRSYSYLPFGLLPLFTKTVDQAADTETFGFPWPLWVLHRNLTTKEVLSTRLTPFWGDRRSDKLRSTFFLWPIYQRRYGLGDDTGYERESLFLFLYRDLSKGEGETRQRTRTLFPFAIERQNNHTISRQGLALFDGIFPTNRELENMYGPLFRLWAWRRIDEQVSGEILWGMFRWNSDGLTPPLYLSID